MAEVMQRAFAAGEVAPVMYSRADMLPYSMGLRTARNVIGKLEGGMMKRPGTQFIRAAKVNGTKSFAFIFNEAQTYHLEMGYDAAHVSGSGAADPSGYIRFTSDKATLVLPAGADGVTVTTWSAASVSYAIRDLVSKGTRHYYCRAAHTSAAGNAPDVAGGKDYWYLLSVNPDVVNGSIYEIPIPYGSNINPITALPYGIDDIWSAYNVQSADVMIFTNARAATSTLAYSSYPPCRLQRVGHLSWDFRPKSFKPTINGPFGIVATAPGSGYSHRYRLTAIDANGDESMVGVVGVSVAGTLAAGGAADIEVTSASHGLSTGEQIRIESVTSTGAVSDHLTSALATQIVLVTVTGASTFTLDDTSGLPSVATHSVLWNRTTAVDVGGPPSSLSDTNRVLITWSASSGAKSYSVYKEEQDGSGSFGFLGTGFHNPATGTPTFYDVGTPPDMSETPPTYNQSFLRDGKHPAICGFFDQRLALANSEEEPQTIWLSRTGNLFNFTKRSPLQDDDSITAPLASKRVNEIRHLRELSDLLVLTRGSEGLLTGAADEAVTPTTVRYKPQGYHGASTVQPVEIADRILYGLARGNKIQEIHRSDLGGYEQGQDPAIYSSHLFGAACGCSIEAMDWAERPDDIVLIVRSDGVLLVMTYMPDQNVRCWTWGETQGLETHFFKDVVVVPEGSTDTPYLTISRVMDGVTGRASGGTSAAGALGDPIEYIEALAPRCPGCSEA